MKIKIRELSDEVVAAEVALIQARRSHALCRTAVSAAHCKVRVAMREKEIVNLRLTNAIQESLNEDTNRTV